MKPPRRISPKSLAEYPKPKESRPATRDSDTRLKNLPPLRLPKPSEPRSRFERRLDARLASLARLSECTPEQCVGLACWLGKEGWGAFAVDVSDCQKKPTAFAFSRELGLAALEYDQNGKPRVLTPKQLAVVAMSERSRLRVDQTKEERSMGTHVRNHRSYQKKHGPNARLLALYHRHEEGLPVEHVRRLRRERLLIELKWSAARLQPAA